MRTGLDIDDTMEKNYDYIFNVEISKDKLLNVFQEIDLILDQMEKDTSYEEMILLIDAFNKLRDHFLTLYWLSYIGYIQNTQDEKFLNSEIVMSEFEPIMNTKKLQYYKLILHSKYKKQLEEKIGKRLFICSVLYRQNLILKGKK